MDNALVVEKLKLEIEALKNREPALVDGKRAAKILGVHECRLKYYCTKLGLPYVVLASRRMYRPDDLREWTASRVIREEVA